jgi:hypothetical protein
VLDPERIDLVDLAVALEDHSNEHTWWLDPATGELSLGFEGPLEVGDGRLLRVQPLLPSVGYTDMEEFVSQLRDRTARRVLRAAITGRGAFRRFKDALIEYPELRRSWFDFHDARGEQRALTWLEAAGLIEPEAAAAARAARTVVLERPQVALDGEAVARRAGRDLARLYGERLRRVLLFGPWARDDAGPGSPVELLVVLDAVADPWAERARMDRIMWRHSVRNDAVVVELPVAESELAQADGPVLRRAVEEGVRVA